MARVSAFQAEGCGFETRLPLQICTVGSVGPCRPVVERTLGKGEVVGSAPITGSIKSQIFDVFEIECEYDLIKVLEKVLKIKVLNI